MEKGILETKKLVSSAFFKFLAEERKNTERKACKTVCTIELSFPMRSC
jgi:hypothetical protein